MALPMPRRAIHSSNPTKLISGGLTRRDNKMTPHTSTDDNLCASIPKAPSNSKASHRRLHQQWEYIPSFFRWSFILFVTMCWSIDIIKFTIIHQLRLFSWLVITWYQCRGFVFELVMSFSPQLMRILICYNTHWTLMEKFLNLEIKFFNISHKVRPPLLKWPARHMNNLPSWCKQIRIQLFISIMIP